MTEDKRKLIEEQARVLTEQTKKEYMGNYTSGRAVIKNGIVQSVRVFDYAGVYQSNLNKLLAQKS